MRSNIKLGLVIANVLGITAYLYLASRYAWAIPLEREHGVYTVTGEPFIWAVGCMWLVSVVIDFAHH